MKPRLKTQPAIELLESRIAPATLFVGKVANFTITTETGAGGLTAGDTVTFTPDAATSSAHTTTANLIFGTSAFTDLAAAITAAVSNADTIRVSTGTFTGPFTVGKNLIFLGNKAGDDARSGRTTAASETILNLATTALTVNQKSTFDGFQFNTGSSVAQGVKSSNGADQWINNIFSGGFGIELRTSSTLGTRVEHNRFDVTGTAIAVPAQLSNTTIEQNTILADAVGIDLQPTAGGANNVILNNVIAGPTAAGIGLRIGAALPAAASLIVRGNFIESFATGVHVLGSTPANLTVRSNSIAANTKAIDHDGANVLDAPFNFYSISNDTVAEVDALVDGTVNFEPFALGGYRDGDSSNGNQPSLELAFAFAGKKLTYTDVDGDAVTVTVTKGDLATDYSIQLDAANFGEGLRLAQFRQSGSVATGTDIIVSVARGPLGDGFADVGFIRASHDLGKVIVRGDLAQIQAGDATPETPAIKFLQAQSMGRGAFDPAFSNVNGRILSMRVLGDFAANLFVTGAAGTIDKLFIGGALTGLPGEADTGRIVLSQNLPSATILGSIRASDATGTGVLDVGGTLGTLIIGGALGGGTANLGPTLHVGGSAKSITIKGGVIAGFATFDVDGSLDTLTVVGDFLGFGTVGGSAKKVTITGSLGNNTLANARLTISGSGGVIAIGGGVLAGELRVNGSATSVAISGDLDGSFSGFADGTVAIGGSVGKLTVSGSLIGGPNLTSGNISIGGFAGSISIGGSLIGGSFFNTGQITIGGGAGTVLIGGSLIGGISDVGSPSFDSGQVKITGNVASVLIRGSIIGGSEFGSGELEITGNATTVTIRGSLIGGDDFSTGSLQIAGTAGAVFIGGSVIGGTNSNSGEVRIQKTKTFTLAGSLIGNEFGAASISASDVGTFRILGDILAGTNTGNLVSLSGANGTVFIGGDVIGAGSRNATLLFNVFTPADQAASVSVKTLTIRGSVIDSQLLFGTNSNPDISAGTITIGGDFRRSVIALGLTPGTDFIYGTDDDIAAASGGNLAITATLGKLVIGGTVSGDPASLTDRGAILAQAIGSILIGGQILPLGAGLTDILIGASLDVRVRELA